MPAVSSNFQRLPSRSIVVSIVSRVVPRIGLTIARFSPQTALSRLDLPTLGRPMIASWIGSSSSTSGVGGRWVSRASSSSAVPAPWMADTG